MNNNIVSIHNLTKYYGKNSRALDNVSLELKKGRIIGLLGPNGAGKTTLIKILTGMIREYEGEVLIDGKKVGVETKRIVSYLPDGEFVNPNWTVKYTIEYYKDFFGDFDFEKAMSLIQRLNLPLEQKFKTLSKGTKEKLQLILTLSRQAELYVFDEPIAGVDPAARDVIFKLIMDNYNKNASIIISTHLISDAEKILDDYIFIKRGRVIECGEAETARNEKDKSLDEIFREEFKCLEDF